MRQILPTKEGIFIFKKYSTIFCLLMTFILGSHNGYIALWREGNAEPARVFPYQVSALPEKDQKALEKGIRISSRSELVEMLEDFLS